MTGMIVLKIGVLSLANVEGEGLLFLGFHGQFLAYAFVNITGSCLARKDGECINVLYV